MSDNTFIIRMAAAACVILLILLSMIKPQQITQVQPQPIAQIETLTTHQRIIQLLIDTKTSATSAVAPANPVTLTVDPVASAVPRAKPVTQAQVECLAAVIYHEARGESLEGQVAVAAVTINRTQDSRWPSTICGVVQQKTQVKERDEQGQVVHVKTVCQYSWNCDASRYFNSSSLAYKRSFKLAHAILHSKKYDHIANQYRNVYYFHAYTAKPDWSNRVELVRQTGSHLFYGDL